MSAGFLTDDISAVFDATDFAVTGTFTPVGGMITSVTGIFDDEDLQIDMGDGTSMLQHSARFTCSSSDVTGVREGDSLVVSGVSYRVEYVKDDGTGVIEMYLETV